MSEQGDASQANGEPTVAELIRLVDKQGNTLREFLNLDITRRDSEHPVKKLHLEQIASHLHSILYCLNTSNNRLADNEVARASLHSLLMQIEDPEQLSRESAWELAGEFERQLIELGDDTYLYTVLKDEVRVKYVPTIAGWDEHFSGDELWKICENYQEDSGKFSNNYSDKAREFLRHLHLARTEEYRRDRAKMDLRDRYLRRMFPWLLAFVGLLCGSYIILSSPDVLESSPNHWANLSPPDPQPLWPYYMYLLFLLSFVFFSGAVGSVLGRAYRLGRKAQREDPESSSSESSIGIRQLLAEGKNITAQAFVGAAAAVIVYIVLDAFLQRNLGEISYGVIGFLTGFSEPFFTRTLEQAGLPRR
jgi:hypothetical protein